MTDILIKFLPGIITAIIASYFTARWSLKKIYSEKWWERREHAYSDIIASLYDIMQYCEYQRDHYELGHKLSEERKKEFEKKYNEAYWKLKKVTDIGGFVISKDAVNILKELRSRPKLNWNENPPWEIYDQDYEYHKQALEKLVATANKDLKVKKAQGSKGSSIIYHSNRGRYAELQNHLCVYGDITLANRDPELTLRNKEIARLTEKIDALTDNVLKITEYKNIQTLNAIYGGKHAKYIDIKNEVIDTLEQFISLYLQGFLRILEGL